MVETALFPRPHFASFLQSDDSADPLSYYEYQRLQRMQKVARLQERRSKSYEPGYKKPQIQVQPSAVHATAIATRQIFTKPLPKHDASKFTVEHTKIPQLEKIESAPPPKAAPKAKKEENLSVPAISKDRRSEEGGTRQKQAQSERLPRANGRRFNRPVKSATVPGVQQSLSGKTALLSRPKTATVGTRDIGTCTSSTVFQIPPGVKGEDKLPEDCTVVVDLDTGDDGRDHMVDSSAVAERVKESMAQAYHWTTSAQRANHEVNWDERIPPPIPPPTTTIEHFPDPVSQKLTFRRYNSCPEQWQVYGQEWDNVQTRFGNYQSQEPLHFHSQYVPGYTGCVPGSGGNVDHPFLSRLLVGRLTPRHTRITKKANIPGYTGHTHWARTEPAHCDLVYPNPLTTARKHREIPLEEELSPFRRTSPMSKTITLVSPFNLFNKIEY